MESQRRFRSIVIAGSVMVGSLMAVAVPELSSASAPQTNSASTTTTTTAPKTTKTTTTTTTNYEVVDGIFTVKANALARIKALTAAKFTKFKIKPLGTTQFAVVHAGLNKTKATALVKAIKIAKIGRPRVKKLA
jgi:hypothetical protein